MPRGKIAIDAPETKAAETDVEAVESEKKNTSKFTLIEPSENEESESEKEDLVKAVQDDFKDTLESHRPNFKFTLLLVTLFVAVNVGLITLLDNSKTSSHVTRVKSDNAVSDSSDTTAVEKSVEEKSLDKPGLTNSVVEPAAPMPVIEKSVAREPVTEKSMMDNTVKPASEKPAVAKSAALRTSPEQDLLSIIGKN